MAVIASLLGPVASQAVAATPDFSRVWSPPGTPLPRTPSVKAEAAAKPVETAPHSPVPASSKAAPARKPAKQETATAELTETAAQVGALPVWVSAAQEKEETARSVTVVKPETQIADAAGVDGLLLSLSAGPSADTATQADSSVSAPAVATAVKVGIDTAALDAETGTDFAARGRLVTMPACALTTPQVPSCLVRTPVATGYDPIGKRLVASIDLSATHQSAAQDSPPNAPETSLSPLSHKAAAVAAPSGASVVLAAESSPSGGGGTYSATSLTPSSAWASGGPSGALTYNYNVQVPAALGGSAPGVSLGYNSSSVDGRTSATNAQASWIGDGWDFNPGFIERSYTPCGKAGITGSGDLCWAGFNATLSLGSHSGQLVRVSSDAVSSDDATGVWRLKNDDGTKVEFGTGATNGTDNGAYAKITDTSGTVYYFGLNHLPGGDKSDPATNSASTVPVYAPNSGDRCYDAAKGKASWCQMWQRLSLDYVVDVHGNLTTYTWAPETNHYSRGGVQNNGNGTLTAYTRANTVTRIDYGQRLSEQVAAKGTLQPAARVTFTTAERCLEAGSACDPVNRTVANKNNWPDVPVDQECKATGTCTNYGPSYFTTKRLTSISTQVRVNNAWQDVDAYELKHSFPDPNRSANQQPPPDPVETTSQKALWLDSVQRTGKTASPTVSTPPVSFTPVMLPNRVDGTDLVPAPPRMNRARIQQIRNETGGVLNVDYNLPDCSRVKNVMPAGEDDNTRACYPVRWSPPGSVADADPVLDWFNHYTVASLTENDFATGAPAKTTNYAYGPAGWHRDDNQFTEAKARTWGDFRGFATVTTTVGSGNDGPKGQTRATYRQGMNGDTRKNGTIRSVHLTDALGRDTTDTDWLAGQTLQTESFDQAGGTVVAQVINSSSGEFTTATQARGNGLPDLIARYPATISTTTTRARKTDNTWRTTTKTTTGDPAHADRTLTVLDQADGLPDLCTRTGYATGPDPQRTDLVAETLIVSGSNACGASATSANTVSWTRVLYDGLPYEQAGATADPTGNLTLDRYDSVGAAVFATISTSTYDAYGRVVSNTDPNSTDSQHPGGVTTNTVYTASAPRELPTTVTTSAPAPGTSGSWDTVTALEPRRSLPLTIKDPNGKTVTETYDALGRLTGVWASGRTPAIKPNANQTFTYTVSNTTGVPSTITSSTLMVDGDTAVYKRSVALLDGFARTRQTQTSPAGPGDAGRLITDTQYDSQGRTWASSAAWYNRDAAPSTTLVTAPDSTIPAQTRITFDGLGRPTVSALWSLGALQSQATASYPGADRTDVVPPQGSWPTGTITDARGRTTELWQYRTATATSQAADAAVTRYTYNPAGQRAGMTDSVGNTWSYRYDLRGRQISASDPDTGTSSRTYDAASRLATTTDAKGQVLTYTYDLAGRKTGLYEGSAAPNNQLAAWTFDTVMKAKPATSTRYVGGSSGQAYTSTVTGYDNSYRPTSSTLTIPGTEAGLASGTFTYTTSSQYDQITGNPKLVTLPAAGGLPQDRLAYAYNDYGQMISYAGATTYDVQSEYDVFGRTLRSTVNPWASQVVTTTDYDQATGRVRAQYLDKQTSVTGAVQQTNYTYNPAGSITSITNIPDNSPPATDRQCFTYDYLGRLTTAWTDTGGITTPDPLQHKTLDQGACANTTPTSGAVAPAKTTVGGGNPYWQDYTYDLTGNRTSLIQHDQFGDPAKDVTTTQQFPAPGTVNTPTTAANTGGGTGGAHALLISTVKTGTTTTANGATQYDANGNTTAIRTGVSGTGTAALTWNSEGKLASHTAPGQITGNGGKCIATAGGSNANGTNLQINACTSGGSQLYTVANNRLVVLGKCVQAMGTTAGSAVQTQNCDNSAAQTWTPRADGTLHNPAANRCLAIPGNVTTSNTALVLGDCASTVPAGQKWTTPNTTTTYLYDADGNQLIRRNPGTTTLTLGTDELTVDTVTKAQTGTRYYPIPSGMTMIRKGAGTAPGSFTVQVADHHGTNTVSLDLTTLTTARRPVDPFGNPRGTQPAPGGWLGSKGFVGGTEDETTGLTNLGARQYQPITGRFISVDPILDGSDPQQINGYAYSNNNPINLADPTGLKSEECGTLYDCGPAGTITMNNTAETSTYVSESALNRLFDSAPSYRPLKPIPPLKPTKPGKADGCIYAMGMNYNCTSKEPNPQSPHTVAGSYNVNNPDARGCDSTVTCAIIYSVSFASLAVVAAPICGMNPILCGQAVAEEIIYGAADIGPFGGVRGCRPNSFTGETQVLLADGTTKEISEIQLGDEVLATDPESGATAARPVIALIRGEGEKNLVEVAIDDDATTSAGKITATDHHPFWVENQERWVDATDLQPGDTLHTSTGIIVKVAAVKRWTQKQAVYNLTIADLHTYYVLAGNTPVLVHNTGPGCGEVLYGASKGAGQDLKRSATVGNDQWQFNTGHGFDRAHTGPGGVANDLRTTGLTPDEIEQGIVSDAYGHMANGGVVPRVGSPGFSGPLERQIQVGGFNVGYRLSQTPDNVYRVATYWLNP
ncbi:polymorphic toxin-type HINT domain-containing protein [Kitasatospora sp. NPDC087315]|uniref:polymorphic toxin-type HINT domain-containing protein n=1 Tax=Kitasatospora sp. NPDC087315 TaxID=3364069 RepID=UPI0038087873